MIDFRRKASKLGMSLETNIPLALARLNTPNIFRYTGCAKKKKDILNIHIKSEEINIFSQKFYWTKSTIFVAKYQNFTYVVQLFMTKHSFKL